MKKYEIREREATARKIGPNILSTMSKNEMKKEKGVRI
jgi:hypothetical protein